MNPAYDAATESEISDYHDLVTRDSVPLDTKEYNLVRDSDAESTLGLWAQEYNAFVDSMAIKGLYFSEDWVYILVDRYASKLSSQRLYVMDQKVIDGKPAWTPALDHPLNAMLAHPNALQDYHTWMYSLVTDLICLGNTIQYVPPFIGQIYGIPAEVVRMDFDTSRNLRGYALQSINSEDPYAKTASFSPTEVVHIRRPNPSSYWWGLSPFVPGRKSILFNRYSLEYLNNFYIKGAQPGMVLEMDKEANVNTVTRLIRSFEAAYQGRRNQRRTMVLPKGVVAKDMSHTLADQQLRDYITQNRETIINVLQVPKHELSIAETGSLGSEEYKIALRNFWSGPLKSTMRLIEGELTRHFKSILGENRVLKFDVSDVEVLQDNEETKATLAEKMLKTHTLNEVRSKVYKMPPLPGGDALPAAAAPSPFGSFGGAPALPPATSPINQALPPPEVKEEVDETKALLTRNVERFSTLVKGDGKAWWQRREADAKEAMERLGPELQKLALNLFVDQAEAIVKAVRGELDEKAAEVPSKTALLRKLRDALGSFEEGWIKSFVKTLTAQVELGYDMSLTLPFNVPNQAEISALRQRGTKGRRAILEERGLESFSQMSKTTTEKVMKIITQGVEDSATIKDIAKSIAAQFRDPEAMKSRAELIARVEVMTASSIGQAAAMQDAARVIPNLKKMWINAGDDRVRGNPDGKYAESSTDHWSMQGQLRSHDKPFVDPKSKSKLDFPRDPKGGASDTINCRCTFIMVPSDEAERLGLEELTTDAGG